MENNQFYSEASVEIEQTTETEDFDIVNEKQNNLINEKKQIKNEEHLIEKKEKSKTNIEDAYIISGIKNNEVVFLKEYNNEIKEFEWTDNILEAFTFLGSELEVILFALRDKYKDKEDLIKNIEIRIFHWEKYNSLNKYFIDLEQKLKEIKSKMTKEEFDFLMKYKDKI